MKVYFPVVLFTMLYNVVLIVESINSSEGVLSCGTVYHAVQRDSYF